METPSTVSYRLSAMRKISEWIFLALLIYMPFHVLLSTWVGSSFGLLTAAKILKDIVLLIGFVIAIAAVDKKDLKALLRDKLVWLIAAYAALTVGLALIRPTEQDAEVLGVVYNLRFLMFFLYGALVISWQNNTEFLKGALKTVLIAGALVASLGVFQYLILPDNALSHLGYSKVNGTPPAFFIDDKPNLERAMSTLKDPNSLGAYMIIIIVLGFAILVKARDKLRQKYIALVAVSSVCLWLSFSRGAVLGLILTMVCLFALEPSSVQYIKKHKRKFALSLVALFSVVSAGLFMARDTYLVSNIVFHADEQTVLEDPNELRLRFWRESVEDIAANPLGSGPGTAGLASIRNQSQGTVLNENYYLQIAQEVGIIGIGLFIAIIAFIIGRLWRLRDLPVARGILASLVGLLFISLLIHTWSNEALSYTWWGLGGLILFPLKARDFGRTTVSKN